MAAPVSLHHVAAGCNRCTHALHWGDAGLLAYAAHNAVLVYDPQASGIHGHAGRLHGRQALAQSAAAAAACLQGSSLHNARSPSPFAHRSTSSP